MEFKISWGGQGEAQLVWLVDNGEPIVRPGDNETGHGEIHIRYDAADATIHHVEWSLWFPPNELKDLKAEGKRVEDAKFSPLNKAKSQQNRWESSGAI